MPYCPSCNDTFPGGKFCPRDGTLLLPDEEGKGKLDHDDLVGQVVADRFRIVSLLGSGGMGTVYEAEHTFIKKRVALKLLRPEITSNPEAVARFQREALAASTIGHENIVAIDDFGRLNDGQVYLTMEYLDGEPLNTVLAQGEMSVSKILDVTIQVCRGLMVAHEKGIVHRDMKPENIFLTENRATAKILDFGIAKVAGNDTNENLTKTGAVFGTPNYMAPEQALGKTVDKRADIYSVGVILYEMLCGEVPFQSESFLAVLTKHVTAAPTPPSKVTSRSFPQALEDVVLRAMCKEPEERYQDVSELIAALEAIRDQAPTDFSVVTTVGAGVLDTPRAPAVQTGFGEAEEPGPESMAPLSVKQTATAGEMVAAGAAPRRKTGLILAITGVAVLLGAGGVLALFHFGKTDPSPPRPRVAAGVNPHPDSEKKGDKPATKVEPPQKKVEGPRQVEVILDSEPSRAFIYEGKKRIGRTPEVITVPRGARLLLFLQRAGYRKKPVELGDDKKKVVVALDRLPRRDPPRGRKVTRPKKQPPQKKKQPGPGTSDHDHDTDNRGGSDHSSHDDQPITPRGY